MSSAAPTDRHIERPSRRRDALALACSLILHGIVLLALTFVAFDAEPTAVEDVGDVPIALEQRAAPQEQPATAPLATARPVPASRPLVTAPHSPQRPVVVAHAKPAVRALPPRRRIRPLVAQQPRVRHEIARFDPSAPPQPTAGPPVTVAAVSTQAPVETPVATPHPLATPLPVATPRPVDALSIATPLPVATAVPTTAPVETAPPTPVPTVRPTAPAPPMPAPTPRPRPTAASLAPTPRPVPSTPRPVPTPPTPRPAPTAAPTPRPVPTAAATPRPVPTAAATARPLPTTAPTAVPVRIAVATAAPTGAPERPVAAPVAATVPRPLGSPRPAEPPPASGRPGAAPTAAPRAAAAPRSGSAPSADGHATRPGRPNPSARAGPASRPSAGPEIPPSRTVAVVARPAAPNAAPSPGDLAGLNARMRAMLPHGDVDTMAHYGAPAMDAPDLDLVAEYVPAEVLAETFGLIRITRSVMHAGSTTYVFEHKKDIFGREVCRALRFTPHPLRTPPPRWDPNHGITWADRNPDLKPEVDYLDVSCSDPRIEAVTPGSLDRPQRSGGARATENAPTGAAVPAASPTP